MKYVCIYAHAFSRDAVRKTLRSMSSTLENHLVKLLVGEDRTKDYWTGEIDSYINNEFDFVIKKDAGINATGINDILYKNNKSDLKERIKKNIGKLKKAGYYIKPEIDDNAIDDMLPKFEMFYDSLSKSLEKRYSTRKSGQKIDVSKLLDETIHKKIYTGERGGKYFLIDESAEDSDENRRYIKNT